MDLNTSWYFKYRPKSIDEYVFESDEQKQHVLDWISNEKIAGNLLLYGPPGTGKTALAELLIKTIIKSEYDFIKVQERSVSAIDSLQNWLVKKPVKSKMKVVYIEELDRLSKTALSQLKDGMLEKYQSYVSYIATTNYINKIDNALLTRFNFKFNLRGTNREGYYYRLKQILEQENIEYDDAELRKYVDRYSSRGLRDLINNLEINVINGRLNLKELEIRSATIEEDIANLTIEIFRITFEEQDILERKKIVLSPLHSKINQQYINLLNMINFNPLIRYEDIFVILDSKISFLPIKKIIADYIETIDLKKFPNISYISFLYEALKCIVEIYP